MLDADGSCVGDGSIMNVRIKMNVNVNPYSYSYFVVWGLGVANLFLTFTKYKAFHWSRVHLPTMCGLTVTVKKCT